MSALVPPLYCPIAPALGPDAEELDAHIAAWMADNQLYSSAAKLSRYQASRFGSFAALTCPHAGIPLEYMKLYTEWLAFGFFYDDHFMDESTTSNEAATVAEAVIAMVSACIPSGGTAGAPAYADSDSEHYIPVMHSLLERTTAVARPDQFERLRTHMMLWWYSYLYEPLIRASGRPVRLPGFSVNRAFNIASLPYVTLAQIMVGCTAGADDLAQPDAVRMGYLAACQMGWCNDIHSADHETRTNPDIAHLPGLLAQQGLDTRTSMAEAVRVHNTTMRAYLDAEKAVLAIGRTGLADYVRILRAWIRGHYDWCRATRRYNAPLNQPT